MFCLYCKVARVENEAPCPNCGAPSPLLGSSQAGNWGMAAPASAAWESPPTASNNSWNAQEAQLSFGASPTSFPGQSWAQNEMPQQPPQQMWQQVEFSPQQPPQQMWQQTEFSPQQPVAPQVQQQFWSTTSGPLEPPVQQAQQVQFDQQQFWSTTSGPLEPPVQQVSPVQQVQFDQQQFWSTTSGPLEPPAQPAQPAQPDQQQFWSTSSGSLEPPVAQVQPDQQPQSMLPVLYQGNMQLQPGLSQLTSQLIPLHDMQHIKHMLPAIPDEEEAVYVPPMYTKPRPIIPKYRVISGFLSVLIVGLLLCSGATYYARATGKVEAFKNLVGIGVPPSIKPTAALAIPNPPDKVDRGPASNIINSATTASRSDPKTHIALQPDKIFQINQKFYVTYSVQRPPKDGKVTVKWYMNDLPYHQPIQSPLIKSGTTANGDADMVFPVAAPGKVELYWNDQLALRLYFTVK